MNIFEITLNDKIYTVELCTPNIQVYSVSDQDSHYIVARDFKGIWIELHRSFNAAPITLSKLGSKIEEYLSRADEALLQKAYLGGETYAYNRANYL